MRTISDIAAVIKDKRELKCVSLEYILIMATLFYPVTGVQNECCLSVEVESWSVILPMSASMVTVASFFLAIRQLSFSQINEDFEVPCP